MPPKTKVELSCQIARAQKAMNQAYEQLNKMQEESTSPSLHINGKQFVIETLKNGMTYKKSHDFLKGMNIQPPSEAYFYREQNKLKPIVKQLAAESMAKARESVGNQQLVPSMDGAYSHPRNADEAVYTMMTPGGAVIAKATAIREGVNKNGNFTGSSKKMESFLTEECCSQIKDMNIVGFVHDRDAATAKIVHSHFPSATEYLDPNHAAKRFKTMFTHLENGKFDLTMPKSRGKTKPEIPKSHWKGVGERLQNYFRMLLHLDMPVEEKIAYWNASVDHLRGIHTKCIHDEGESYEIWKYAEDPKYVVQLTSFVQNLSDIFKLVDPRYNTNNVESMNSTYTQFVPKSVKCVNSYDLRTDLAVIYRNEGNIGLLEASRRSGTQLPPESFINELRMEDEKRFNKDREDAEKVAIKRAANRRNRKKATKGSGEYGKGWKV